MEAEWKEEREHHLQQNNTMVVRERETAGWTPKNTRFGHSLLQGEASHRDADYRQKHRQADRRILRGSVNLCSTSWSMIPQ